MAIWPSEVTKTLLRIKIESQLAVNANRKSQAANNLLWSLVHHLQSDNEVAFFIYFA